MKCYTNEKQYASCLAALFKLELGGGAVKEVKSKKQNRFDVVGKEGEKATTLVKFYSSKSSFQTWLEQLSLCCKASSFPGIQLKSTVEDSKAAFPGIQVKVVTEEQVSLKEQAFPGIATKVIKEKPDDETWKCLIQVVQGWNIEKSSTPIQIAFGGEKKDTWYNKFCLGSGLLLFLFLSPSFSLPSFSSFSSLLISFLKTCRE